MNILLDARSISRTGIGSYTKMLIHGLSGDRRINLFVMGSYRDLKDFVDEGKVINVPNSIYSVSEQLYTFLAEIRSKSVDLVHYTNFNKSLVSVKKYVVTVHDLIQFKFKYGNKLKLSIAKAIFYNSVSNARSVICVSQSTRNELLQMFPDIDESKVRVVYNPSVNPLHRITDYVDVKHKYGLERYILYVGNRKPHKNVHTLVKAFRLVLDENPSLKLVIVGKKFKSIDEVDREIESNGLRGCVLTLENIQQNELISFYRDAELTVLPSLEEGFGLTPFESIAQGTLPLVSDIPVMRELFFDETNIFFDPSSPEDIARKISFFLLSEGDRENLVKKLSKYLGIYSFERFLENTVEVYKESLK
ncbi:MAG: glycosyltransferase family 1 protein [Brevinematia bacterium]